MRILSDAEVLRAVSAQVAVDLMEAATIDSHFGRLVSPPRPTIPAGGANFTLTAGGRPGGVSGFRVYGDWGPGSDQLTAVWSGAGSLQGIVLGPALGRLRTGALGGVAVRNLARADSSRLGVIGSGPVAWGQVWAAVAVRSFDVVDIYSPTAEHREAFARRVEHELGVAARPVGRAESAVVEHDVVIVSPTSVSPVLRSEWVSPGTHLSSTGPKLASGSELEPRIADIAEVVASDSPQQAAASGSWFSSRGLDHLGAIAAGELPGRRSDDDVTLYCSTGLAGTEVLLAEWLIAQ